MVILEREWKDRVIDEMNLNKVLLKMDDDSYTINDRIPLLWVYLPDTLVWRRPMFVFYPHVQ